MLSTIRFLYHDRGRERKGEVPKLVRREREHKLGRAEASLSLGVAEFQNFGMAVKRFDC